MFIKTSFNLLANKLGNQLQKLKRQWQRIKYDYAQELKKQRPTSYRQHWRSENAALIYAEHMKHWQEQIHANYLKNPKLTASLNWALMHSVRDLTEKLVVKKCSERLACLRSDGANISEPLAGLLKPLEIQKFNEISNLKKLPPEILYYLLKRLNSELYSYEYIESHQRRNSACLI